MWEYNKTILVLSTELNVNWTLYRVSNLTLHIAHGCCQLHINLAQTLTFVLNVRYRWVGLKVSIYEET